MRLLPIVMLLAVPGLGWAAPEMRVLATGGHSGVTRPEERVARTAEAFQTAWDEYAAHIQPKPPLPAVDFRKEMVLAIFMGQRPTSGYSIAVTAVMPTEKALVVSVRRT